MKHFMLFFLAMSLFVFTSCGDDEGVDPDPDPDPDYGMAVTADSDYFVGTWQIDGTENTITFNADGTGSTTAGSEFELTEAQATFNTFVWNFGGTTPALNFTYASSIPTLVQYTIDETLERKADLDKLGIDVVLTKED